MTGKETNETKEEFIKENIDIKETSSTNFYKLIYGKAKILNSQDDDITNKCIDFFSQSTINFTNGDLQNL